jgi:hypothetical protein
MGMWWIGSLSPLAAGDLDRSPFQPARQGAGFRVRGGRERAGTARDAFDRGARRWEQSESKIARWQRFGFILTTPERQEGYLHLSLGAKSPHVVATDHDFGSYRIEAPLEEPESD